MTVSHYETGTECVLSQFDRMGWDGIGEWQAKTERSRDLQRLYGSCDDCLLIEFLERKGDDDKVSR